VITLHQRVVACPDAASLWATFGHGRNSVRVEGWIIEFPQDTVKECAPATLARAEISMKYRLLGDSGVFVSGLCLGSMTFGGRGQIYEVIDRLPGEERRFQQQKQAR
jgi:hypothetical protein